MLRLVLELSDWAKTKSVEYAKESLLAGTNRSCTITKLSPFSICLEIPIRLCEPVYEFAHCDSDGNIIPPEGD